MSEIQNNGIPLKKIVAPSLNQSNYAENLSVTFDNIDKNFATLANYDFIKGESGESIRIEEVSFFKEDGELNGYGEKIHKYFEDNFSEETRKDITVNGVTISLFENFTPEKAGNLFLITTTYNDVDDTSVPVSSLYYVFLDGRFSNGKFAKDKAEEETYNDIEDLSCILVYDKNTAEFKSLNNAFPTIYYEKNAGLCWKVNGNETGIPVKGQRGDDGKDAMFYFVKCERTESDDETYVKSKVVGIYNYPNTTPIEDFYDDEKRELDNCAALILLEDDTKHYMYFGQLVYEDEEVFAYYYNNMELTYNMQTTDFINVLKGINITSPDFNPLRGLFIPMEAENKNSSQSVHFVGASSITNQIGDQLDGKRTDMILTPINDINDFDVTSDPGEQLIVEKYLYVKFNKNNYLTSFAYADDSIYDTGKHKSIVTTLSKLNYTLKYKLDKVYNNKSDFDYVADSELYPKFGYIKFKGTNKNINTFNGVNILYKNNTNTTISSNCLDDPKVTRYSLPKILREKINVGKEIYRWTLCSDQHDFDAELLNGKNDNKFIYDEHVNVYFKHIFTSTPTPSLSSEIAWFNALEVAYFYKEENGKGKYVNIFDDLSVVNNTYTPVLYGWGDIVQRENMTDDREAPLSFLKFIPVFNNDFKYNDETTLNVNYNINVTGDVDSNNKRNININGDLNCDNLTTNNIKVGEYAEIGEIKDIYTKNSAIIDGSIKIGKRNNMYNASIDNSGNALLKDLRVNNIIAKDINSININSTNADIKNLNISYGANTLLTANIEITNKTTVVPDDVPGTQYPQGPPSNQPKTRAAGDGSTTTDVELTVSDYSLSINADKTKSIVVNKFDDTSVITNNMSIINHEDSNIILSDDIDFAKNINEKIKSESGTTQYNNFANIVNTVHDEINSNSYEVIHQNIANGNFSYSLPEDAYALCTKPDNFLMDVELDGTANTIHCADEYDSIFKYDIEIRPNNKHVFDNSKGITIKFNKYLMFIVKLESYGATYNKNLPSLAEASHIELRAYYKIEDENYKYTNAYIDIKFNSDSYSHKWTGVHEDGYTITTNGISHRRDRYQGFIFKPDEIRITDSNVLETIKDAYDTDKKIKIIIRPYINIQFDSSGWPDKIFSMMMTNIVPVNSNYIYDSNKQIFNLTKNILYAAQYSSEHIKKVIGDDNDHYGLYCIYAFSDDERPYEKHVFNWKSDNNTIKNVSHLLYNVNVTSTIDDINSNMTYLAKDGILFTHGKSLFGFGYYKDSNKVEPRIIYYDNVNSNSVLQTKPISDLFK